MRNYVLIEWRDPCESGEIRESFGRAAALARDGNRVTLLLVRDGVSAALRAEHTFWLAELRRLGVDVIADAVSLVMRQISPKWLSRWVRPATLSLPVDTIVEGSGVDWLNGSSPIRATG
jgi:hypothetical protein